MSALHDGVLAAAARQALKAPSVLNTQPWRWTVGGGALELSADNSRQLQVADPGRRMLLVSCGAALHHARLSIAAAGWGYAVSRPVAEAAGTLLATIRLTERVAPSPHQTELFAAIGRRRTDRRPFAGDLPDEAMLAIRAAVEAEGMRVHRVRWDQLRRLIAAAQQAISADDNESYRAEVIRWTQRDPATHDGLPADTLAPPVPRRVPTRVFTAHDDAGTVVSDDGDRPTSYLVLFRHGDQPADWLRAGEALSAALVTAATLGVACSPMSDLIEVESTRDIIRSMLVGMGDPYMVLRSGTQPMGEPIGHAPRRSSNDVVELR